MQVWRRIDGDAGATMVEYGIMLAFVAAILFVVVSLVGLDVFDIFADPRLDLP